MGMPPDEWSMKLEYTAAVANWLLDLGDSCAQRGDVESALICNQLAARVLARQSRDLTSSRIEANMLEFAKRLPVPVGRKSGGSAGDAHKEEWLHVFTEALPYGGHTAMAMRWMSNDQSGRVHSVALLGQKVPVPDRLRQAVLEREGDVYIPDADASLMSKADWLRRLVHERISFVVLHIDVDDVVARLAFGVEGGPPVLLVNHSAHIFWAGASITDMVINCRGSKLEETWTKVYRGIPRCATIPIPLAESASATVDGARREKAREKIGLPTGAFVILTVGDTYKYTPMDDLDFLSVSEDLLRRLPGAYILAVGVKEDERWRTASERVGSRLRALGRQSQIGDYHDAADLYIEGFPFGSTTALLEAGLRGLPVILAPASCPPPYGSDGVALDDVIVRPRDIEEYRNQVLFLNSNNDERERIGTIISQSIRNHHTGAGWMRYLEQAVDALPSSHCTYPQSRCQPTPQGVHQYWTRFRDICAWDCVSEALLDDYIGRLLSMGVRPKLTRSLWKACAEARSIRIGRAIPLPVMYLLCNILLPLFTVAWATAIYRGIASRCYAGTRTMRFLGAVVPRNLW
jgi:hypothetical protein